MKICFPVEADKGLKSEVYGHFGSAPMFVIYDSETKGVTAVSNKDMGHEHGACNPVKALDGRSVNAIIVGGIGAGAISKLNMMGIKVYKANAADIQENISLFTSSSLRELTLDNACNHEGGCGH